MTTETGLVPSEQDSPLIRDIEESFALATRRRELLSDWIKTNLNDKHTYHVKEGSKPSLRKEGAELICLAFGLKPEYTFEGGPTNPPQDDTPYQITMKCRLMRGDSFQGEGFGSASSHQTTKGGKRQVRQPDIGLRHNSTLKMAQKSAYIAATLGATAASEFLTQDMEDMSDDLLPSENEVSQSSSFENEDDTTKLDSSSKTGPPAKEVGECPIHLGQQLKWSDLMKGYQQAHPNALQGPSHAVKSVNGGPPWWCNGTDPDEIIIEPEPQAVAQPGMMLDDKGFAQLPNLA